MTNEPLGHHHTKRDAEILQLLGFFLIVLAIPTLLGTFWAGTAFARVINVIAGLIIGGIGVGMMFRSRWTRRHLD